MFRSKPKRDKAHMLLVKERKKEKAVVNQQMKSLQILKNQIPSNRRKIPKKRLGIHRKPKPLKKLRERKERKGG